MSGFKWSCSCDEPYILLERAVNDRMNSSTRPSCLVLSHAEHLTAPPHLWEKSENHGTGHQKTNNFLCRLLTSCFCVWGPNGAVMISQAFAWQSSSQTLLVSPIQTGSSTIATVNCFSLLLRQSHTLSERLIKWVLFCFLFLQNHLWNLSAPFQKQEMWLRSDKDPLDFIQITWASVIRCLTRYLLPSDSSPFHYSLTAKIYMVCVSCNLFCLANYWLLRAQNWN